MDEFRKIPSSPVSIYALGGLDEVGKNTYCIENEKTLIMIDAGVKFSEENLPGVNYVIPDYTHLKNQRNKIKALFITHGHEDHIGAIPFLLQTVFIPVIYAPKLACALIRHKLEEFKLKTQVKIVEYNSDTVVQVDDFKVEFFHVTHSIPDSYGIVVSTPHGTIMHSGDFKIDLTPIDSDYDLPKLASFGARGVDLLLADSTNAEIEGYTQSEKSVITSIYDVFHKATGRLIISTFSSNLSRIQQIVEAAVKFNRKIVIFGRSMESNISSARSFGYIHIPDANIVTPDKIKSLRPSETVILCTGSQGEPMAALSRIANGEHRYIRIIPGDTVVFSSSPIPGNTGSINKVVNQLTRCGANVLVNSVFYNLHASGHPAKQELRLLQKIARPKYFMPIHGDYRMLKIHADVACEVGMPRENTFVLSNGDTLILKSHKITEGSRIPTDAIYIDGNDINGLSTAVIKDRLILNNDGMVAVLISLDSKNNKLLLPPHIETRGFVYNQNPKNTLIADACTLIEKNLNELFKQKVKFIEIKDTIRSVTSKYFYQMTRRNPMIIPVIMNKTDN